MNKPNEIIIFCFAFLLGIIVSIGYYSFIPSDLSEGYINLGSIEFGEPYDIIYAQARCLHDGSDWWQLRIMDASNLTLYTMYRVKVWKNDIVIEIEVKEKS